MAFNLFADKGYEATSVADIAAGVGVTKSALYVHFGSKEDLFLSIYDELNADYNHCMERLFEEVKEMDIPDKLYHLFEEYLLYFMRDLKKNAFWYRAVLFPPQTLVHEIPPRIIKNEQNFSQKVKEIFQEGMAKGVIRKTSVDNMYASYIRIREGFLVLATIKLLNEELDEHKYATMIRTVWDDYWLGIKEHQKQD